LFFRSRERLDFFFFFLVFLRAPTTPRKKLVHTNSENEPRGKRLRHARSKIMTFARGCDDAPHTIRATEALPFLAVLLSRSRKQVRNRLAARRGRCNSDLATQTWLRNNPLILCCCCNPIVPLDCIRPHFESSNYKVIRIACFGSTNDEQS
jgi:hypothetical protein